VTAWPSFTRGGYEIFVDDDGAEVELDPDPVVANDGRDDLHRARLMRVTGILDWAIKGDGFGAMAYYGGGLFAEFMLELADLSEEEFDGVMQLWKESYWDPNKKLRRDSYRGTQAHMLFEHLCQGETELVGPADVPQFALPGGAWWIRGQDGLLVVATGYDAGACKAYAEIFRHFDPSEILSEQRVYWTEHPIQECEDEVCQHGYAGKLDALVQRTMVDVKTNKGDARWAAYPQMAMYGRAALQRGLIDAPIEKQIVVIPRPDGDYEMFDEQFVGDEIVDPILEIYKQRRAWGPK